MAILSYDDVKNKPTTFNVMTGLTKAEFEDLCVAFRDAWDEYITQEGMDPSKGGRKPKLRSAEDRLFFILFYFKTYPLQEVIGHLFGLSQGQANFWIHRLSLVLKKALKRKDSLPARLSDEMLARLETEGSQDLSIDGTERRINRPNEDNRQREHFSGKKNPYRQEQSDCGSRR